MLSAWGLRRRARGAGGLDDLGPVQQPAAVAARIGTTTLTPYVWRNRSTGEFTQIELIGMLGIENVRRSTSSSLHGLTDSRDHVFFAARSTS